MTVLALNSGSSSLKFALFSFERRVEAGEGSPRRLAEGAIEGIGGTSGRLWVKRGSASEERLVAIQHHEEALALAFDRLGLGSNDVRVVGHRVVHGGPSHIQPARVDAAVLESLRRIVPLAPLHMPACLKGIEAVAARDPSLPQVVCFDTAFHATLPDVARRLSLPDRFSEVRRYGFHGLSYEYVMSTLGPDVPRRVVIAHLGNGASLVAVKDGRSVDTTMGFTPTGGLPMGTRVGDLDPGVLLYLARTYGLDTDALERLVNLESGLLAVGGSSDMKSLVAHAPSDPRARLAVAMFGYRVRQAIGAFAAALGGLDLLVFTGGIGEHVPEVRAEACRGLEFAGVELDAKRNEANAPTISTSASRIPVRVVPADEARVVAQHAHRWT